jgi:hypothetical protein
MLVKQIYLLVRREDFVEPEGGEYIRRGKECPCGGCAKRSVVTALPHISSYGQAFLSFGGLEADPDPALFVIHFFVGILSANHQCCSASRSRVW